MAVRIKAGMLSSPRGRALPWLAALLLALFVSACASQSPQGPSRGGAAGAHYKVGNPYVINGKEYTPREDYSYDETGIASWYGDAFHKGTTANGEIFNKNELTAAHKTLPLPTLARVTNLENGRSIVVRVNDRGPFAGNRVIDMSQRSAQLLGFEQKGTAMVRVQVLADESRAIADAMRHYGEEPRMDVASAAPPPEEEATQAASLRPQGVETKTLEPVRTTPAVHQQLLETKPVAEVVQMPVGPARLYVQAGAFTVLENATKLQQTLSRLGQVSVSDIVINGRLFHRVRVGPLSGVAAADAMMARVRSAGIANARTVVN